jgi:hypothetical protein
MNQVVMFLGDLLAEMKKSGSYLSTSSGDWGADCQNIDAKTADNTTRDKFYELMPQVKLVCHLPQVLFCCKCEAQFEGLPKYFTNALSPQSYCVIFKLSSSVANNKADLTTLNLSNFKVVEAISLKIIAQRFP